MIPTFNYTYAYVKTLSSLKYGVNSQVKRLKQQKSFCDLIHGLSLCIDTHAL